MSLCEPNTSTPRRSFGRGARAILLLAAVWVFVLWLDVAAVSVVV